VRWLKPAAEQHWFDAVETQPAGHSAAAAAAAEEEEEEAVVVESVHLKAAQG
jgi:hypothetical protein